MKRVADYLFIRHRHNWIQLIRFGVVGGSGVLVNLFVVFLCHKLGPGYNEPIWSIPGSPFNVRFYHLYWVIAFCVANVWNFQLNRTWTFKTSAHASWWREFWPFFAVGAGAAAIGMVVLTALVNPTSPLALPAWFDDSSGLRSRGYWGQLIGVLVTVPVSFVLNKLWTFSAVRGGGGADVPMTAPVTAPELVDDTAETTRG